MKLIEMKVNEFIQLLGSNEPAPGGGSASGLAGSMGISLTKMVAELTIGKKKYQEHDELAQSVKNQAEKLQDQLLLAIDADTEAFNQVSAVFSMPKETADEKEKRKAAMQNALKGATLAPYHIMELCLSSLQLTEKMLGKSNASAASDLGVAALNLKSALAGAWLNVLINLSSIKDEKFIEQYKQDGQHLLTEGYKTADAIYEDILKVV